MDVGKAQLPVAARTAKGEEPAANDPGALKAAREFERYFLDEMMKAMRSTVSASEITKPSMGEKIYREQLDQRYVESWSENGGVGLADLILEAIRSRHGAAPHQAGPNLGGAVSARSLLDGSPATTGRSGFELSGARAVAPWAGRVRSVDRAENEQSVVQIDHGKGWTSAVAFRGQPSSQLKVGASLNSGEALGVLSPGNPSVFLNLASLPDGPGSKE
jgi:Rod binding domain-containing protein